MYERKEKGGYCYYPSFFYTFLDIPDYWCPIKN